MSFKKKNIHTSAKLLHKNDSPQQHLRHLDLSLASVAALRHLQRLDLCYCDSITDAGLESVAALRQPTPP